MFSPQTYQERRQALMHNVKHGLIVLRGNSALPMNYQANHFSFVQDASFRYCTGLTQPDLWLFLDCDTGQECLCGPEIQLMDTVWSGPRPCVEDLAASCGLALSGNYAHLQARCSTALKHGQRVHYLPQYQAEGQVQLADLLDQNIQGIRHNVSLSLISALVALRSIKTPEEIAELRSAIALSASVYALLMQTCRPGIEEQHLYAQVVAHVVEHGCQEAFPTILSVRGETLHNHAHTNTLRPGDLLLIDSGTVSPNGYASDITRTLPVSGTFSSLQRDIYSLVVRAQRSAIACLRPGVPFVDAHIQAARVLATGLCDLGFMRGDPAEAVAVGAHALFFPHGLGHMLGLDAHDMEALGEDFVGYDTVFQRSTQFGLSGLRMAKPVQAGNVLTIEPGIYFIPALISQWQANNMHTDFINYDLIKSAIGFGGIRLEDDILVTEYGVEILSTAIPLAANDIEQHMSDSRLEP